MRHGLHAKLKEEFGATRDRKRAGTPQSLATLGKWLEWVKLRVIIERGVIKLKFQS